MPRSAKSPSSCLAADRRTGAADRRRRSRRPVPARRPEGSGHGGGWNMERYRNDEPEWKTRGFPLQVVMDHRRSPDLLVALSNCEWPINVLGVHEADYKDEDLVRVAGGSGGGGGMMQMPARSG